MVQLATSTKRFDLGQMVATPGAMEALDTAGQSALGLLMRHQRGDWGDLGADDKARNDEAITEGSRIFSAYILSDGTRVWIITEADRAATTILLPDEY